MRVQEKMHGIYNPILDAGADEILMYDIRAPFIR